MNVVAKGASINIYYKTHDLSTGSSVIYNIIGDDALYYALDSPANSEIDASLNYADYYMLEAIYKYMEIKGISYNSLIQE